MSPKTPIFRLLTKWYLSLCVGGCQQIAGGLMWHISGGLAWLHISCQNFLDCWHQHQLLTVGYETGHPSGGLRSWWGCVYCKSLVNDICRNREVGRWSRYLDKVSEVAPLLPSTKQGQVQNQDPIYNPYFTDQGVVITIFVSTLASPFLKGQD